MTEAMLYSRSDDKTVSCDLCAHRCSIPEGKTGLCMVRLNQDGVLYSQVYGKLIASNTDPIEKKPLFHIKPGSTAYSVATVGCNFRCRWCQNWEISQMPLENGTIAGREQSPEETVRKAIEAGCASIAYTYTEPTIYFEYAYDTAKIAHEKGLLNVFVTNGYMTREALEMIAPYLDAANVDLKAFRDEAYRNGTGARRAPVLDSMKSMKELDIWVEVTTLIVPGFNDDMDEIHDAARFIVEELGPETPWHLSRYHPSYRYLEKEATPIYTMENALKIGKEAGLRYVYLGNIGVESDTYCHICSSELIRRQGFWVSQNSITSVGTCPNCDTPVAGVAMESR